LGFSNAANDSDLMLFKLTKACYVSIKQNQIKIEAYIADKKLKNKHQTNSQSEKNVKSTIKNQETAQELKTAMFFAIKAAETRIQMKILEPNKNPWCKPQIFVFFSMRAVLFIAAI